MKPYSVSIRFDLDRQEDRAALSWLSQSRRAGFKTNSASVIAAINEYCSRRERLADDPYLETREKEDAFLQRVLDTIRQGMEESGGLGGLLRLLQAASGGNGGDKRENPEQLESLGAALEFADAF